MPVTSRLVRITSIKHLRQLQAEYTESSISSGAVSDVVKGEDFYQQLSSLSNIIISVQYNEDKFLNFKVYQAKQGKFVYSNTQVIGLECLIGGKTYTFNREHLDQMSNRECSELFNQLGVDGSQFFLN